MKGKKRYKKTDIEFSQPKKTPLIVRFVLWIKHIPASGIFRVLAGFAFIFLVLVVIIFVSEANSNSRINNFFDAFWYSLVTITTVGYGDITPSTILGRLAGIILLLFGVVAFAGVSGKVASFFFDRQVKKDRGLIRLEKIKNHFLICGWKPNFDRILLGIISSNPDIPIDHIVLINNASPENMDIIKTDRRFKGLIYLFGDYTDEATLLRANVRYAERALILSDYSQNASPMEIDSRTVLAVLTIGSLNSHIYTAAELIDSKFRQHLSLAHCDEIILSTDYERSILVSASSGTGLSHVLRELITEKSGEGLIINDIPFEFIGKTYREYRRSLSGGRVLIGLLENTGNFYSRRKEALHEAQKNPNIQQIVNNLKKIKRLKSNEPILTPPDEYIIKPNSRGIFVSGRKRSDFTLDGTALDDSQILNEGGADDR